MPRENVRSQSIWSPGILFVLLLSTLLPSPMPAEEPASLLTKITGRVVDAATRELLPCRLYIQDAHGKYYFPEASDLSIGPLASGGNLEIPKAVIYKKQNWLNAAAVEAHTTLATGEFTVHLEPGVYQFTLERGKEYYPLVHKVQVTGPSMVLELPLKRWINMTARSWFSGDTHVHRSLQELPNVILAEDLNVAFPMTFWVTRAFTPPVQGDRNLAGQLPDRPIEVTKEHVIWPRNTEWEIFTINSRSHTLGALFALGHVNPFTNGAPPLSQIAHAVRQQKVLLDLDKHDWPWSIALVPLLKVDLFELANNHVWRTEFSFTNWSSPAPEYMQLPNQGRSGNERDWLEYTHRTYWALLNCGFRMKPTAGTANGVHPVPLGFGRVYVHLPGGFSYEKWLDGLAKGNSFVTTGPMLFSQISETEVAASIISQERIDQLELIVNGEIMKVLPPTSPPARNKDGAWEVRFREALRLTSTSWVALRCWEKQPAGRERFAHTAPKWFEFPNQPLLPKKVEAAYFVQRVQDEITRSEHILPPEAIAEYKKALQIYQEILGKAR